MSLKLGIIGAGAIGRVHAQSAKKVGVDVFGVADVNGAAAKSFAEAEGLKNHFDSPSKLLASPEVTAVVIGVPNKFHAPLAVEALNAGKDVLLEKPMAMSVAECQQINDAVKKSGKILQMGFVHRYSQVGLAAKQIIDAGRVGKIYHAKAAMYRRRGIPGLGGWFTTKAMSGGGPLIDIGVHVIDLAMHLMNFPKVTRVSGKVYANFGPRMKNYLHESMWAGPPKFDGICDVEDSAHALVRFEGGATLEINVTWAGNIPDNTATDGILFLGDKGGLGFKFGGNEVKLATEEDGFNVDISPKLKAADAWEGEYRAFVKSVTDRTTPEACGVKGQVVQSIIQAIYESSEKDREVEL